MNLFLSIILALIPITYYTMKHITKKNEEFLQKFNMLYHLDNTTNEFSKKFLEIGKFPYHAFKEKDVDKGMLMDDLYLNNREQFLDSLSLQQHIEMIDGLDSYLKGDISSIREAKRISKERGYQF